MAVKAIRGTNAAVALEARRNWFRLLDEVAAGETVVIERNGMRVLLQREPARKGAPHDYSRLISGTGLEHADRWGWSYDAEGQLLPDEREP